MIKNFNFILKKKYIFRIIFYLLVFFIITFFSYFFTPKFFNYSSQLIEESLKVNNDINIKNISRISYKVFPTPRLKVSGSNFDVKKNILEIDGSELEIILNPSKILNYKKIYYNKIIIKNGSTEININNFNQILNYFKKNKLKISLRENNLIFVKNNKFLFEVNKGNTAISPANKKQKLDINGTFLNHKISFLLDGKPGTGNNLTIKIPKLDILGSIFLGNKNEYGFLNGFINVEVLNNFFQFNFKKEKDIKIKKGFIRNNLINSSFEGKVALKPNFFFNLTSEPKILNMKKLFPKIQKEYFSDTVVNLELLNKINGVLNFKKKFQGNLIFENGEILFKNFKTGANNSIRFDAKISEFGKKGKIHFNIFKTIQHRKNTIKELEMSGFIVPSTSKVVFEKVLFDKENYKQNEINNFEEKFKKEVVQKSISNIFNELKMNNFFNNFSN